MHNISFQREDRWLFKNLNSELMPGQCLQVQGANGSGKSTLLRILAGLIELQQGEVIRQQPLHYIGHQNGIKLNLTVAENLALQAALFNSSTCLLPVIHHIGLSPLQDTVAGNLSAGQKRRLSFAKLLLSKKPLWILDEPTTSLDKSGQDYFIHLLNEHLANQGMAVIATHHPLFIDEERNRCLTL